MYDDSYEPKDPLHVNILLTDCAMKTRTDGTILMPIRELNVSEVLCSTECTVICPEELLSVFEEVHGISAEQYALDSMAEFVVC